MMFINNALRAGTLVNQVAQLSPPWQAALRVPSTADALGRAINHVEKRLAENTVIYPATPFRALQTLLPTDVRVVILGQDPYHGPGQAQGLAFSVPDECKRPPSLRNIFLEMAQSLADTPLPAGNDLSPWAQQGVLLLNTVLTVEAGQAASHAKCGWETVTDALIALIAQDAAPKVFMLWGAHAQAKQALFPPQHRHLILTANHPSPLSARRPPVPFLGCGHFVIANQWLKNQGLLPIQWRLEQKLIPTQREFAV